LQQITNIAKESSLTGCLEKGSRSSARQYNRILQVLEEKGLDLSRLFEPLSEDESFEEIGVAAAQLAGYLTIDSQPRTPPVPPVPPVQRAAPVPPEVPVPPQPPQPGHAGFDFNNFAFEMGNLKELDQLKGLGQMIREQLPEWIKREVASKMAEAHQSAGTAARDKETSTRESGDMESKHATRRLEDEADNAKTANFGSNFSEMNMCGARFSDTNLADSAFSDVNFAKVEFTDVNFGDVVFADCNMAGARFADTHFEGATFSDVQFSNARFKDTCFNNVELNDCDVSGMKINGVAVEELLRIYRQQPA
jgi:hypothetical protein